jgi:hypothetical protein
MAKQNAVSLEIPVLPEQVDALTEVLNSNGNPASITADSVFPFHTLPEVHFARWIIAPATTTKKGDKLGATLVYAANVDGKAEQHLQSIVERIPQGLDKILSNCVGYPEGTNRDIQSRMAYLTKYKKRTQGFYVGAANRTVDQIRKEADLHSAIRTFVKANQGKWKTQQEAHVAIKEMLAGDPQWDWARAKYKLPGINWPSAIGLGLFMLVLLPLVILWIIAIRVFYESRAEPYGKNVNQVSATKMSSMKAQEDIIYQNQLSQVFETKGGLRKLGLHFWLFSTTWAARAVFVKGVLMGTPTIHFARWMLINNGKRFVFFSNFDGPYDMYLGDFVDNNGWGLNAIYGAAEGYPQTKWVFGGGSYKMGEFMGWGRICQVHSQSWYSAYPWLGQQQIVERSKLRSALFNEGALSDKEVKEMLERI